MYYRILKRASHHYEVQARPWWWPFWRVQVISMFRDGLQQPVTVNTTLEDAKSALHHRKLQVDAKDAKKEAAKVERNCVVHEEVF